MLPGHPTSPARDGDVRCLPACFQLLKVAFHTSVDGRIPGGGDDVSCTACEKQESRSRVQINRVMLPGTFIKCSLYYMYASLTHPRRLLVESNSNQD